MGIEPLDVVARLRDHQNSLQPRPVRPRCAIVGLPTPLICRILCAEVFRTRRAAALARMAVVMGGGDGPAPIVDLDQDGRPVDVLLAELEAHGIETLVLHGERDQPGFARAVRYRWPGALAEPPAGLCRDSSVLAPLMDDPAPVVTLAPGVVRVGPGAAIPATARLVLAACEQPQPEERAASSYGGGPAVRYYAVDSERQVAPWSGILPPDALLGTAQAEALRARWRSYWHAQGWGAAVRCAALGLDPVLEARLTELPAGEAAGQDAGEATGDETAGQAVGPARGETAGSHGARRARLLVVAGPDRVATAAHAAGLARALGPHGDGRRTAVLSMHGRAAAIELAGELAARTRHGAPLAAFRVARIVGLIDAVRLLRDELEPALAAVDAVIMDGYVELLLADALGCLGWDLGAHPLLGAFPRPDRVYWLDAPPARADAPPGQTGPGMPGIALFARQRALAAMVGRAPGELMLDACAPLADNLAMLAQDARAVWGEPAQPGTPARAAAIQAPADRAAADPGSPVPPPVLVSWAERCQVIIGNGAEWPVLGQEAFAVRQLVHARLGARAGGVPESFWLEAYAAQLLVDIRSADTEIAYVPLWPEALARMHGHADCGILAELGRMLAAAVVVRGYQSGRALLIEHLARSPAAARRAARAYGDSLEQIAARAGWRPL